MTTLNSFELLILRLSGWRLRAWLAITIFAVLATMPPRLSSIVLWLAALPYLGLIETLVRILGEQHRIRQRLETERDEQTNLLAERAARITALEADLDRSPGSSDESPESTEQRLYRRVGLHPQAPGFLITAARRAYRAALHPDRHPRHRERAHRRYLDAEETFERILELRR